MIPLARVPDWMLAAGLALFVAWALFDYGRRYERRGLTEQSHRVEESLRQSAPQIDETDRRAIEEGEDADETARKAENELRTAHDGDAVDQCLPVPARCFGVGVVRLRHSDP